MGESLFNPTTAVSNHEACLSIDPGICLPVTARPKVGKKLEVVKLGAAR